MADKGEGFDVLRRTQWGYASHPNMAGVLMIGLGCEVFQIERLKREYGLVEGETFRTMTIQTAGGTRKSVEAGVAALREMLPTANKARRESLRASELVLALQCGGSDGYSGKDGLQQCRIPPFETRPLERGALRSNHLVVPTEAERSEA